MASELLGVSQAQVKSIIDAAVGKVVADRRTAALAEMDQIGAEIAELRMKLTGDQENGKHR
jgi:hypothetical protein